MIKVNNTKLNTTRICQLVISPPVLLVTSTAGSNFWHVWYQICIVTHLKNNQKNEGMNNPYRMTRLSQPWHKVVTTLAQPWHKVATMLFYNLVTTLAQPWHNLVFWNCRKVVTRLWQGGGKVVTRLYEHCHKVATMYLVTTLYFETVATVTRLSNAS